ncbi:MAG: phenylalanine--tRNA ligase subunit alpha, partial [Chthoniobacterales bacterium]
MTHPLEELRDSALTALAAAIEKKAADFRAQKETAALANIDVTLPGTPVEIGALHPLTQMLDRAIGIFRRMGFALATGPDVETEWYCFDALNTPADHPARNEQDTFYLR